MIASHLRIGVLTALSALFACMVLGCDEEPETTTDSETEAVSFEGVTVSIAVPEGYGFEESWRGVLDEWSAMTEARTRIETVSADAFHSDRLPEGATMGLIPLIEAPVMAGQLARLPRELDGEAALAWEDVFKGLREAVGRRRDRPYVVPVSAPCLVCYYRADLLEAAGKSPPRTWDEYQELAETIEEWAPGTSVVEPWGEAYRATTFLSRAVGHAKHPGNLSFYFDLATGEPLIARPGFVRALEAVRPAVEAMPRDVLTYSPQDCRRELLAGNAALGLSFETGSGNPPVPFGPKTPAEDTGTVERADDVELGFVRLPGAAEAYNFTIDEWQAFRGSSGNQATLTLFGGLGLAVTASASEKERLAAWSLVAELVKSDPTNLFPGATKSVCRETQAGIGADWTGTELTGSERGQYVAAVVHSLRDRNIVAELPLYGRDRFRAELTQGLGEFLEGDASAEETLQGVASAWERLLDKLGQRRVLDSYRLSLGRPLQRLLGPLR